MDSAGLDPVERQAALDGLRTISTWPGQRGPILRALAELLGRPKPGIRRLIEVGAGSGHLSQWVASRLRALGHTVEVLATDLEATGGVTQMDALSTALPEADIYFSNLMLHHLEDADVQTMFQRQAAVSRVGVLHYDLHRHWAHFYGARFLLKAGGLPEIVRSDGATSIQQGFSRRELRALAEPALPKARITWHFPFRWLLTWKRR
jgi:hypothetical protein